MVVQQKEAVCVQEIVHFFMLGHQPYINSMNNLNYL